MTAESAGRWPLGRRLAWGVLGAALAALAIGVLVADRAGWPSFIGDEATYLMQAESLAWDGDLLYTAGDYHRFVARRGLPPVGLILQSGDGGRHVTFGKPVFYAVWVAPFLRLLPDRGPFVANVVLLALAAVLAARVLERPVGPAAPLWVAALLFATPTFAYAFWVHPDLFMLSLSAIALALAVGDPGTGDAGGRPRLARWVAAGALLTVVVYSRPLYAPLFLPALLALPRPRWRAGAALLVAALGVAGATAAVHQGLTGSWTGYGASRLGFYPHTGYPAVDFPAEEWRERLGGLGEAAAMTPAAMLAEKRLPPALLGWDVVHFLVGRHVGLVPYFLPALLALVGRPRGRVAWGLLAAVAIAALGFFYTRPFNFYGGGGTLANRYFLPLYPALWLVPTRLRARWVAVAVVLAGLFVHPLWRDPAAFPIGEDGRYRYVTPLARQVLPFETTQSHLKLAGREDLYDGFFLRLVGPDARARPDGTLVVPAGGEAELLLGSPRPLAPLFLGVRRGRDLAVEAEGATLAPAGPGRFTLHLDPPIARHPMWWTWQPVALHHLVLRFPDADRPVVFRLRVPPEG